MKAVVDTNVVAYLLLGTAGFVDESRTCFVRVVTPLAPAHWEAELARSENFIARVFSLPDAMFDSCGW